MTYDDEIPLRVLLLTLLLALVSSIRWPFSRKPAQHDKWVYEIVSFTPDAPR
jgi:hypothetical protein